MNFVPCLRVAEKVRVHALAAYPDEACGFVLLHLDAGEHNVLQAKSRLDKTACSPDAATASAAFHHTGPVWFYHSHPDTPPSPSPMDRRSCDSMGMPFLIYSCTEDSFELVHASKPWSPYTGLLWSWGSDDCWGIVRRFYLGEYGVLLRDFERPASFPPDYDIFSRYAVDAGFDVLMNPDPMDLRTGDVLSFRLGAKVTNHLGIVIGDRILHHQLGGLSSVDDLTDALLRRVVNVYRYRSPVTG